MGWTDNIFETGPVAGAHKELLLRLRRQVWEGLLSRNYAEVNIEGVVVDLEDYARAQFCEEEALMATHDYPGLERHRASHVQFVTKVNDLSNLVAAGETVGLKLLGFLNDWLTFHIGVVDLQFSDYMLGKQD